MTPAPLREGHTEAGIQMKTQTHRTIKILSLLVVVFFILAQFIFMTTGSAGPWCFPYLDAPPELGSPTQKSTNYGFPLPIFSVIQTNCIEPQSTSYEWSSIGFGVDGLLLILLAYPIWQSFLKKKAFSSINNQR